MKYFLIIALYKYLLVNITRFSDLQFFQRFRFPKYIVLEIILPMIYLDNMDCNFDRRGLKIDNITKVLIALRFYASGNDQVFACNLNE